MAMCRKSCIAKYRQMILFDNFLHPRDFHFTVEIFWQKLES